MTNCHHRHWQQQMCDWQLPLYTEKDIDIAPENIHDQGMPELHDHRLFLPPPSDPLSWMIVMIRRRIVTVTEIIMMRRMMLCGDGDGDGGGGCRGIEPSETSPGAPLQYVMLPALGRSSEADSLDTGVPSQLPAYHDDKSPGEAAARSPPIQYSALSALGGSAPQQHVSTSSGPLGIPGGSGEDAVMEPAVCRSEDALREQAATSRAPCDGTPAASQTDWVAGHEPAATGMEAVPVMPQDAKNSPMLPLSTSIDTVQPNVSLPTVGANPMLPESSQPKDDIADHVAARFPATSSAATPRSFAHSAPPAEHANSPAGSAFGALFPTSHADVPRADVGLHGPTSSSFMDVLEHALLEAAALPASAASVSVPSVASHQLPTGRMRMDPSWMPELQQRPGHGRLIGSDAARSFRQKRVPAQYDVSADLAKPAPDTPNADAAAGPTISLGVLRQSASSEVIPGGTFHAHPFGAAAGRPSSLPIVTSQPRSDSDPVGINVAAQPRTVPDVPHGAPSGLAWATGKATAGTATAALAWPLVRGRQHFGATTGASEGVTRLGDATRAPLQDWQRMATCAGGHQRSGQATAGIALCAGQPSMATAGAHQGASQQGPGQLMPDGCITMLEPGGTTSGPFPARADAAGDGTASKNKPDLVAPEPTPSPAGSGYAEMRADEKPAAASKAVKSLLEGRRQKRKKRAIADPAQPVSRKRGWQDWLQ